jgi:lipid-A-disaccharide synthase
VPKIAISAAEISGDLIAASLIQALKKQNTALQIEGLCGEKMRAEGCRQLWDMKRVNVMGFSEILRKLPALIRLRRAIIRYFSSQQYDVFIGVDAPDFNFKIERKLKRRGIKTIHFISPSVWAWRQSRVKKIKKSTDLMLCLFPFEVDFYKKYGQKAVFVGHPLAEQLSPRKIVKNRQEILLMPGSRAGEVKRLLPEMLAAANIILQQKPELNVHLALANRDLLSWAETLIGTQNISISVDEAHLKMQRAALAVVASGTATLELALVGVPMVVIYKMSNLSYFIASRLLKSRYISLPNIIADKTLVPELIQANANAENIASHALAILASEQTDLIAEFRQIHTSLRLNASVESAKLILDFIDE